MYISRTVSFLNYLRSPERSLLKNLESLERLLTNFINVPYDLTVHSGET